MLKPQNPQHEIKETMSADFATLTDLTENFEALDIRVDNNRSDRVVAAMNRPEVLNAIDQTMVDEFHALCDWSEANPRTLVTAGTTSPPPRAPSRRRRIFASGAVISQLRERRRGDALRGVNSQLFSRIKELPMPVIAAIDGVALGG